MKDKKKNYLVVSLHDAAPPYLEELRRIALWLDENLISPYCIKVIPNFLEKWNILENKNFLNWLLAKKENGREIIQHGFIHKENKKGGSLIHRLRNSLLTHSNAEFQKANYEEAKIAIEEGKRILKEAGIECAGFTSPTWFQSKDAVLAIKNCGFRYYTSFKVIYDCQKEKKFSSVAMGFQGINVFLENLNSMGNWVMKKTGIICSPLARIVIHPQNISANSAFSQALKLILHLARKRKLVTYSQFLNLAQDE